MYLNVINILKFYIVVKCYRKRITRKVSVICRVLVKTADTACCKHCKISRTKLEELMMEPGFLTKDEGSILVGEEAVNHGIIDEVGGIDQAICRLRKMIEGNRKRDDKAMEK